MSFNKEEFLKHVMEALEVAIDEYIKDSEADENLNALIDDFDERLSKFNDKREACGYIKLKWEACTKATRSAIIPIMDYWDKYGIMITDEVNFFVNLLNAPEIEDQSTGKYEVTKDKLYRIYKNHMLFLVHDAKHWPYTIMIEDCFKAIFKLNTAVVGGYNTALVNAALKLAAKLYSLGIKIDTSKAFQEYYMSNEKVYRKYVLPNMQKDSEQNTAQMVEKEYFDHLTPKYIDPDIITFINELEAIRAESLKDNMYVIPVAKCIRAAEQHICALSRILRCIDEKDKDTFMYLITKLRKMKLNGDPKDVETRATHKIAGHIIEFLKKENLLCDAMLDPRKPVEYVYYKTQQMNSEID